MKNRIIIISVLCGMLVPLLISCEDDDDNLMVGRKVIGVGDMITQTHNLSPFNKISNAIPATFHVTIGGPQEIVVRAQQNVLDAMVLKVENAELHVDFEEDVTGIASSGIELDITVADFNSLNSTHVGTFFISGPKQNELSIDVSGIVNVEAYDLVVDDCLINMTGSGSCKVKVNNRLDVVLEGSGIVYYRGNPTINAVLGTGNVIDDN